MSDTVDNFPVLYILMRNDLESMNAGKAMAQASHSASAFVHNDLGNHSDRLTREMFRKWSEETTQGFGTVLVLAVNEIEMRTAVDVADKLGYVSGVVHDPTYPLPDGDTCHFIPLDTCSYIFGDKNDPTLATIVSNFPLHP